MREIKFKYYFTLDDKVINTKTFIMDDIEDINFNTILFLNIDINKDNFEKIKLYRSQYTGLKDKNDVEIYNGDIITYLDYLGQRGKGQVLYSNEDSMYIMQNGRIEIALCILEDIEVIGNIYENSDLL